MIGAVLWEPRRAPRERRLPLLAAAYALGVSARKMDGEHALAQDGHRPLALPSAGDGQSEHFEAFFRAHEREIFGYLWRITGDEQASYDLAQETFVRAWQRFERVRHYEQPRSWLFRVATNLASNYRRNRSARSGLAERLTAEGGLTHDPATGVAESEAIRMALDTIPVKQRGALVLRVVYGLSFAEIGRVLGCSEAGAKMALSRARERFRAQYDQEVR